MKTSREQFEAWFENDVVGQDVTFPEFDEGAYLEGDLYDDQLYLMLQAMWMAWRASRESIEAGFEPEVYVDGESIPLNEVTGFVVQEYKGA